MTMYHVNIAVNGIILKSSITDQVCTINMSYQIIKSEHIVRYIQLLRDTVNKPDLVIHKRSIDSMVREWKAHNILFALRICPSRTSSCDLELNPK